MVGHPASHIHASDLVSSVWGSYFFCQERKKVRNLILQRALLPFRTIFDIRLRYQPIKSGIRANLAWPFLKAISDSLFLSGYLLLYTAILPIIRLFNIWYQAAQSIWWKRNFCGIWQLCFVGDFRCPTFEITLLVKQLSEQIHGLLLT